MGISIRIGIGIDTGDSGTSSTATAFEILYDGVPLLYDGVEILFSL
jgi:hypothetical protein